MTKEQQRIAIAEACGWTDCEYIKSLGLCKGKHKEVRSQYDSGHSALPDYLNDLNAMHEAEKVLMNDDPYAYGCYSCDLYEQYGNTVHLSAAQRAEAFLKTMGKWEEAQ